MYPQFNSEGTQDFDAGIKPGLAPGLNLVHAFASKFRHVGDGSHAARLGSVVDGL